MVFNMEWLLLLEKGLWFGLAAIGFSVLFNVPPRTIFPIWMLAAVGGLTRVFFMQWGVGVVLSSLAGSSLIGVLSISAAHNKHAPPLIFSIPAVIPMVPGVFAYRMVLGLIKLAGDPSSSAYPSILFETVNNGIKVVFILMALAVGVSIPTLLTRKTSIKNIRLIKKKKHIKSNK
jgi:uncharacterized membrane protein YjjB (DUF3815 family)